MMRIVVSEETLPPKRQDTWPLGEPVVDSRQRFFVAAQVYWIGRRQALADNLKQRRAHRQAAVRQGVAYQFAQGCVVESPHVVVNLTGQLGAQHRSIGWVAAPTVVLRLRQPRDRDVAFRNVVRIV